MAANGTDAENCAVCGRGILKGERTYEYATPAGEVRDVCALCRPSAERAGWAPPGRLESVAPARRERRRGWAPDLAARLRRHRTGPEAHARNGAEEPVTIAPGKPATVAMPRTPPPPQNGLTARLAEFNSGQTPRMIAGLCRSLGDAKAEVKPMIDGDGILVTVAWELSWYSWEVTPAGVREVSKGADIAERPGPEPEWNAHVEADGRLTTADRP